MTTDFRYIKLDETKYCDERFLNKYGVGTKVISTYVFDANEHVYICDLSPYYDMRFCGSELHPGRDLTEEEWTEAYDFLSCGEDCYMYCRDVKEPKACTCNAETIDDVVEQFQTNPW